MRDRVPGYVWPLMAVALAACSAWWSAQGSESAAGEERSAVAEGEAATEPDGSPTDDGGGKSQESSAPTELLLSFEPWVRTWRSLGEERVGSPEAAPVACVRAHVALASGGERPAVRAHQPPGALHKLAALWPCGPPVRC